jgi:hypothetical protein
VKNINQMSSRARSFSRKVEGRILPPLILWMLGVPGGVCVILWFFFFKGK